MKQAYQSKTIQMNPIDNCGPFKAMEYEYVMRRIYNCGRDDKKGANADIFRRFMRNASTYRDKIDGKFVNNIHTKDKLEIIHEYSMIEVVQNLKKALHFSIVNHKYRLSEEHINELNACIELLVHPSIEIVLNVVERTNKVLIAADIKIN